MTSLIDGSCRFVRWVSLIAAEAASALAHSGWPVPIEPFSVSVRLSDGSRNRP